MIDTVSMPWILRRDGWFDSVTRIASPNHDRRPSGCEIELIVLHAISIPPGHFGGPEIIDFFAIGSCPMVIPTSRHSRISGFRRISWFAVMGR